MASFTATDSRNSVDQRNRRLQETFEALESGSFVDQESLDELTRECKGDYECEITFEGGNTEDKLHDVYHDCEKNPGHPNFIPVSDFKIEHLPKQFRKEKIMRSIQYWINLTVKVMVRYVSKNRPDTFPNSEKPYPYSRIRGSTRIRRFGTGNIFDVASEEDSVKEEWCPCHLCNKPGTEERKKEFWTVLVETSKHVIFDSSEAKCSIIECFYDSDSSMSETVKTLYGYAIHEKESKIDEDLCQVLCVTHDEELVETLKNMVVQNDYMVVPQYEKYLGILISHPHGCSKRITVGQVCHMTVPVGWDYPTETPIPCDDTVTCRLPLYPWSKYDSSSKPLQHSSHDLSQNLDTTSYDSTQMLQIPDASLTQCNSVCAENIGQFGASFSSISALMEEDKKGSTPAPGKEFLLPLGTTFTLPKEAKYALRFHHLNSTYFNFPPGTHFNLSDGTDVFFPPEAEFSMYMLSTRVSYVSYTVDSCPGSSGAGLLLDGGNGTICCTYPHSGKDDNTQDANRSGLQCYTIVPKSTVSTEEEYASQSIPTIMPQYVRFQIVDQ